MAIKYLHVGASEGLVRIDDVEVYSDNLEVGSFRTNLQGYMEQEPTHDNHVVRLLDLNEAVSDIGDADALDTGVVSYENRYIRIFPVSNLLKENKFKFVLKI